MVGSQVPCLIRHDIQPLTHWDSADGETSLREKNAARREVEPAHPLTAFCPADNNLSLRGNHGNIQKTETSEWKSNEEYGQGKLSPEATNISFVSIFSLSSFISFCLTP